MSSHSCAAGGTAVVLQAAAYSTADCIIAHIPYHIHAGGAGTRVKFDHFIAVMVVTYTVLIGLVRFTIYVV